MGKIEKKSEKKIIFFIGTALELTLNPFKTKKITPKISKIDKIAKNRLGFNFFNNFTGFSSQINDKKTYFRCRPPKMYFGFLIYTQKTIEKNAFYF